MRDLAVLLLPFFWSLKNEALHLSKRFYKRAFLYLSGGTIFVLLFTLLLNTAMTKLHSLSPEVFNILIVKALSLIFLVVFFVQIINGFIISLNTFYNSREMEVLIVSPVNRVSLFISRLIETYFRASWMLVIFGIPILLSIGMMKNASLIFYIVSIFSLALFSFIPVAISTGVVIFLTRFVNAIRLKNISISILILSTIFFITILRLLRPEYLVNPEGFANLTLFLIELKTSAFILLPNRWLGEIINHLSEGRFFIETMLFFLALLTTSYITFIFSLEVFARSFYSGWEMVQIGVIKTGGSVLRGLNNIIEKTFTWLGHESLSLVKREVISFIRDSGNIRELLVLSALIIIYAFSVSVLPLNWEGYALRLTYMASLFNTGIILIIITAICSRIIYPILSEGTTIWLVKTSPLSASRYILTRYILFLLPVFVISEALVLFSFSFIPVQRPYQWFEIAVAGTTSSSILSLTFLSSLSKNTIKKVLSGNERPQAPLNYMFGALFIVAINLLLMIIPIRELLKGDAQSINIESLLPVTLAISLINLLILFLSLKQSVRLFKGIEI
jgi:hypothetical protein